jgi:hypothetical protein
VTHKDHAKTQKMIDECTIKRLMPHLEVYLCADRFFMEDLKATISSKLLGIIFISNMSGQAEVAFLDKIFQNTRSDDLLRYQIIKRAFKDAEWLSERGLVAELTKKHESVAWNLGQSLTESKEDKLSKTKKALHDLREYFRWTSHCNRCGRRMLDGSVLIRCLKEGYAIDCSQCKSRQWTFAT